MSPGELFDWTLRALGAATAPGAGLWWYVRERRKSRAADEVAEQTVPAEIALRSITADDARLAYVDRAMEAERSSYRNAISERDREIDRQRAELAHRDELIATLRVEAENLRDRLAEATRQLSSVMARLDELAEADERRGGAAL